MKKRHVFIYKILVSIWIIILNTTCIMAQLPPAPLIQSPNVSSLGTFGNIPVSYYTGTPDISVPIYTLSCGDIKVPIELKYHPASVKPNEHPGWVGLGWNLQSYGCINRVPHGMNDEDNSVPTTTMPYYPIDNNVKNSGSYIATTTNWDVDEYLKLYLKSVICNTTNKYDVCADEFYFNFLGYSGKFCYTYEGWKVISDQNIKIELGDENGKAFISGTDFMIQIQKDLSNYNGGTPDNPNQPQMFYGFILTTEDGTKYFFGGAGAIEYGTNYYSNNGIFSLNNWYLKKIKDVNGNEINFTYHQLNPVVQLAYYCNRDGYGCSRGSSSLFGLGEAFICGTGGNILTSSHSGRLIWPLYLSDISTSKNEKVTFETTISKEKDYPYLYYAMIDETNHTPYESNGRIGYSLDNIKWEKLSSITINYKDEKIFGYNFYYNPSTTQRLTLDSIRETDKSNLLGKVYKFEYNDIPGLPDYGGNWTDHWGYYNGTDIENTSTSPDIIAKNKNTDPTQVLKGLIQKVTYPTGGYSKFDWEANFCENTLSTNHKSLVTYNGNVGGCRIKKISNYTSASELPITKEYFYVSNYSNSTYDGPSESSGILNGIPKYNFTVTNRPCDIANENCTMSFNFFSTNGYSSYTGLPVGYSEVTEKNGDGSYTKFLFSNYGTDCNGKSHYDISSTYIGWKEGEDVYIPFSSLEQERGKMLGIFKFNNNDIPVEKTSFRYRDDDTRFGNYIKRMDYRNTIGCSDANSLTFASALKDFNYNYYLIQKETDQYDKDGKVTIQEITDYTYNSFNQIASEKKTNSDNSELTTNFKYPMDYSDFEALPEIAQLKQKFIINPPIEKIIRKNDQVVNAEYSEYNTFFTNLIKPQKIYQFNSTTPIIDDDFYFKKYTIEEEDQNLWVEEGCDDTQSVTFNVATRSQVNISLRLSFPSTVCGYYKLNINGSQYKVYTGISDNSVLETNDYYSLPSGNNTITFSYITYPGYESSAMLGSADITIRNISGDIQYNSNLVRPIATLDYNIAGEIAEIQKTNDIKTSYLWGYNQTYPVVKIEGKAYADITDLINTNIDSYSFTGSTSYTSINTDIVWLKSQLSTLLNDKTCMVTFYTYAPLIGMTSSTDPNGVTTYYEYDSFGRLKYIKDDDGRILKTYEYNYQQ